MSGDYKRMYLFVGLGIDWYSALLERAREESRIEIRYSTV